MLKVSNKLVLILNVICNRTFKMKKSKEQLVNVDKYKGTEQKILDTKFNKLTIIIYRILNITEIVPNT